MMAALQHQDKNVSRETDAQIARFKSLILRWNPVVNLVSRGSIDQLDDRHIADSLQICDVVPEGISSWCDIGSGGGFPGLIVALRFAHIERPLKMTLVEVDQRKSAFLREAARELDLDVSIVTARAEALDPMKVDVVSARAVAPLSVLCGYASRHLKEGGLAVFSKGSTHEAEITAAKSDWNFDVDLVQSKTDPSAAIVLLRNIDRAK